MPRPRKKRNQAKAQRHRDSTQFTAVKQSISSEQQQLGDPTYIYTSSGEEEIWTDTEDEPEIGDLAEDISALQTLYSCFLPPHMQAKGVSTR